MVLRPARIGGVRQATEAEWQLNERAIAAVNREAELRAALSAIVRAYDHPADGTAHTRMRSAIVDARKLLGQTPVSGVDGESA